MERPCAAVVFCLPLVVLLVSACGTQFQSDKTGRRYEDLRALVLEQRRAIEDMRREQESLRASVDELQYGRHPGGRPLHGPGAAGGAGGDSYWGSGVQRPAPPVPQPGSEYPSSGDGLFNAPTAPGQDADSRFSAGGPGGSGPVPKDGGGAGAPATDGAAQPPSASGVSGDVPSELVGTTYDSGMRALNAGDHDEAIQHFRNFLHDNASSPFADDAQYWIGEAYYRKGQYHRAIIELNQVSITYGSGNRAPAALVRQAEAFRIVGDRVDAKLSLQKVINRYPGTGEAAKASKMLSEIGG